MSVSTVNIKGEHTMYCCGAKVRISDGNIKVLTEPTVKYCPLHNALYGTSEITPETVRQSIEKKIANYGFFCENRLFNPNPLVAYGASEMISTWLDKNLIDCAVIVCEGAGTVITANGKLVQSIGARLTGIIETSPIDKIIERIESQNGKVLNKTTARIDQVEGVKKALEMNFKRIAVSVAGFQAKDITEIRKIEKNSHAEILIFSVCNTCVKAADVKHITNADIACASASKLLRKRIGFKALIQLGTTIPVYILKQKGKKLVLAYLENFPNKLVIFRTSKLPYHVEGKGPTLKSKRPRKNENSI